MQFQNILFLDKNKHITIWAECQLLGHVFRVCVPFEQLPSCGKTHEILFQVAENNEICYMTYISGCMLLTPLHLTPPKFLPHFGFFFLFFGGSTTGALFLANGQQAVSSKQ